jgi:hypothetical protein
LEKSLKKEDKGKGLLGLTFLPLLFRALRASIVTTAIDTRNRSTAKNQYVFTADAKEFCNLVLQFLQALITFMVPMVSRDNVLFLHHVRTLSKRSRTDGKTD